MSSSNKGTWILNLLSSYKQNLNEKKLNLDDDYIKFIRYGEYLIHKAGKGILAYISNNSFIDGVTHRQMRKELLQEFDSIYIIDLHGSSKKHEKTPEGDKDENVFDIQQGVSINIFIKKSISSQNATVYHLDAFGLRTYKYDYLNNVVFSTIKWKQVLYEQPYFFFVPKDLSAKQQYEAGFSMLELFEINNSGIKTDRDTLFIDVDKFSLADRIRTLLSGNITDNFKKEYRVEKSSSYRLTEKIQNKDYNEKFIKSIVYRPFDSQWIYYDPTIISRPGYNTMQHMLHDNYGLYVKRGFEDSDSPPVFCCDKLICMRAWSRPGSIGSEYLFPLFKYSYHLEKLIKSPNFNTSVINKIENSLNIKLNNGFNPLDLLDYIYAVLHCGKYINKYREFIKIEFPRVPYPTDKETFWKLVEIGSKLRECHLMHTDFDIQPYSFTGDGTNEVVKPEYKNGRVYISKTQYFDNVPQAQWEQYIGGYQSLQKWLKDRKKMVLSSEDIEHYKKIIAALKLTEELMAEIDEIVEF